MAFSGLMRWVRIYVFAKRLIVYQCPEMKQGCSMEKEEGSICNCGEARMKKRTLRVIKFKDLPAHIKQELGQAT